MAPVRTFPFGAALCFLCLDRTWSACMVKPACMLHCDLMHDSRSSLLHHTYKPKWSESTRNLRDPQCCNKRGNKQIRFCHALQSQEGRPAVLRHRTGQTLAIINQPRHCVCTSAQYYIPSLLCFKYMQKRWRERENNLTLKVEPQVYNRELSRAGRKLSHSFLHSSVESCPPPADFLV